MKPYSIVLSAGEASGDLHGAHLVGELKNKLPKNTCFWGGGGTRMGQAGVDLLVNTSGGGTIGVFETLLSLPTVFANFHRLRAEIQKQKPDLFIPIDFGAFNTRLAKAAYNSGVDVVYYIPPGSWRRTVKSADGLRACGGKAVTPFQWSYEGLKAQGIDVRWSGHPLLDIVKPSQSKSEFYKEHGLKGNVISMFLGSRGHEISSHLFPFLQCAEIISLELNNASFIVGAASNAQVLQKRIDLLQERLRYSAFIKVVEKKTYECMAYSDFALVTSGTATLETAILDTPMLIAYRGTSIMRFEYVFRKAVVESCIGLPNLIAQGMVVPEMLGNDVNGESLAAMALSILSDEKWQQSIKNDYARIREILGGKGALGRAADAVIELAKLEKR